MSLIDKLRGLFQPKQKGPAQRAGEKIDHAAQELKQKVQRGLDKAVDKAADKVIEAGEKLKRPSE